MDLLEPPRVVERPEADYLGIRVVTPFRGMLSVRNELIDELSAWLVQEGVDDVGLFFLRLHVIDMNGPMDLEVGVTTPGPLTGDARVRPDVLPAGRYVTLTYRNHSLRANRALLDWAAPKTSRSTVATSPKATCSAAGTSCSARIPAKSPVRRSGRSNSTSASPNRPAPRTDAPRPHRGSQVRALPCENTRPFGPDAS